ncbi:nuclear RNA export factor 1-like [Drosophila subobscura]|uniref:nuclear RNA export factor 1-like n=1 Tax=Drosophila subobscura TaxID=7241 RepID=UPI00155B333D|nr:nuclear RNA export factor 1-like [Drosophila subobscura]
MKIVPIDKSNSSLADRRAAQMKAQPRDAPIDLKKNFQNKETLNDYIHALMSDPSQVTASIILKKLDTICTQNRTANKAIVSWSTVELLNCEGVADAYIFLALKYLITPETFEPFNFKRSGVEDNGARGSLALDNLLSANRLKRLREKLNLVFSCKNIRIRVIQGLPEHTLNTEITSEFIEAAKCALRSSYDADTRTLKLSRFHAKPELGPHFCPLYVDKFFECVLHLILEQTPRVSKIILSDNYLCSLKAFDVIPNGVLDGLECLDLSSNKIRELADLQYLANLKLKSLILRGNGMAKLKQDEILAILPRLHNLEGCLQTQCQQEVPMALPNLKLLDISEPNCLLFVNSFIKHFYQLFDQPNQRSQLEQHYHERAIFSLSVPETLKQVYAYGLYYRNFLAPQSTFARASKMKIGRMDVVHALTRFPRMETFLSAVWKNVLTITPQMHMITLTGQFMEHSAKGGDLRNFQRNFVLEMQEPSGVWLIRNDMFCIIPPIKINLVKESTKALAGKLEQLSIINHVKKSPENIPPNSMNFDQFNSIEPVIDKALITHSMEEQSDEYAEMPRLVPMPTSNSNDMENIPNPNSGARQQLNLTEDTFLADTDDIFLDDDDEEFNLLFNPCGAKI